MDNPVIILTTGRSGSTLLQKLLNTNTDLIIWGEHLGILNQLMNAWKAVQQSQWIPESQARGQWLLSDRWDLHADRWTAWDGSFSKRDFIEHLKGFTDNLFCRNVTENCRWGFKEIRYSKIEIMEFILELYQNAQFILLLRDPVDSCASFASVSLTGGVGGNETVKARTQEIAKNQIKPFYNFCAKAVSRFPDITCRVLFENLVEDPLGVLDRIRNFLGLATEFNDQDVAEMMSHDLVSQRSRIGLNQLKNLKSLAHECLQEESLWYKSLMVESGMQQ